MTLIIEIALGIVLGFILLSYLDVIIGSAVVLVGGAIALGLLFFVGSYFFEHLSDVFELAKGLLLTVLVVFGSAVVAFFVGLTSQKLPGLRKLGSSDKSTTLKEVIDDFSVNKKSDLYIDFLAEKIRIGYLTIFLVGFLFLICYVIGKAFFQSELGGFIGIAAIYALLIFLIPYAQKPHQMTDSQLKEQIEIRKGLGYDTKDLEDKLTSK
jgi:hypothetical protein